MNVANPERVSRYLSVILRWLLVTSIVFALTILVGNYIVNNFLPKIYTATAQIQIRPQGLLGPLPYNYHSDTASVGLDLTNLRAEFEVMQSPDFLLPIVIELGLDTKWATRIFQLKEDQASLTDTLAYLQRHLSVSVARGTNIVNITVSSDVPEEAAQIANDIALRYKTTRDLQETDTKIKSEAPVRIISRAVPPSEPSSPNKSFDFVVTLVVGALLSLTVASFIEIVLLFKRAGERSEN